MDIGKGDFVECVDDSPCRNLGDSLLTAGTVYIVRECREWNGKWGLMVEGIVRAIHPCGIERGWLIERFRPVYRPNAQLLQSLLTNIPEGVE